jgi:hypothetical protein
MGEEQIFKSARTLTSEWIDESSHKQASNMRADPV